MYLVVVMSSMTDRDVYMTMTSHWRQHCHDLVSVDCVAVTSSPWRHRSVTHTVSCSSQGTKQTRT